MFWQIVTVVFLVWICKVQWGRRKYFRLARQLKIDIPAYPIIGQAYMFIGDNEAIMTTLKLVGREVLKHGGIASGWLAHRLFIVVGDPAIAEVVLKTCLEKDDIAHTLHFVFGNGSLFAPVSIWHPRRKILIPTFSSKNLAHFEKIFAQQSAVMVQVLKERVGTGAFPIWSNMTTYTMDSICETTLGINMHIQKDPEHPFLKNFEVFSELVTKRTVQPWLHSDLIYKLTPDYKKLKYAKEKLDTFIHETIKLKRKELKCSDANNKPKNGNNDSDSANKFKTFLELLIQSSGGERGYSDEELKEEIMVIVVGGTDTSAVGASFTALMLSQHQDVQEKVYEELKDVFGDSKRLVTLEDLPRLKYLEAVIRETLRLYPPVPVTLRKFTEDITLPSGITLLKGCGFLNHVWAIHRNQEYWGADAEQFRPERFLDFRPRHPAQFMAFSYGMRSCVGSQYAMMSAKTVLATLLLNYKILPAKPPKPNAEGIMEFEPLRLKIDIMMKDMDNYMVALESR